MVCPISQSSQWKQLDLSQITHWIQMGKTSSKPTEFTLSGFVNQLLQGRPTCWATAHTIMVHTAVKCNLHCASLLPHISGHEPKKQLHACNFPLAGNTFTVTVHPMRHNPLTHTEEPYIYPHTPSLWLTSACLLICTLRVLACCSRRRKTKTFPSPACPTAPRAKESGQE